MNSFTTVKATTLKRNRSHREMLKKQNKTKKNGGGSKEGMYFIYFFSPAAAPARIRARSSNRSRSRFVNPSEDEPAEDPPPPSISACNANCFARPSLSASHTGSQSFHPPVPYARASPAAPNPAKVNAANATAAAVPSRRVIPGPLCRSADATMARRRSLFCLVRRTFVVRVGVGVVERVVGIFVECVECVSDVVVSRVAKM